MTPFLAVDWGTSNLRAWRLGGDMRIEAELDLPIGVSRLPRDGVESAFDTRVRRDLDPERKLPVLMCGMVGSSIGWKAAPYAPCPAGPDELAKAVLTVADDPQPVRIVPGLSCSGCFGAPDVMRGEEVQIVGWLALDSDRSAGRHIVCHPGTHSKWVRIQDGMITGFVTSMTGELFDVLLHHSILAGGTHSTDPAAFAAGVSAAGDGGALSARLFSVRSRLVAGDADPATSPSYLSGLLIGSEIAAMARLMHVPGNVVHVVGSAKLCAAYQMAFNIVGQRALRCDGEQASIAGLAQLVLRGALR